MFNYRRLPNCIVFKVDLNPVLDIYLEDFYYGTAESYIRVFPSIRKIIIP